MMMMLLIMMMMIMMMIMMTINVMRVLGALNVEMTMMIYQVTAKMIKMMLIVADVLLISMVFIMTVQK